MIDRAGDGIVRHLPDGSAVADRRILAASFDVTEDTIRRKLKPTMMDERTGRALYDVEAAAPVLERTKGRPKARVFAHFRATRGLAT